MYGGLSSLVTPPHVQYCKFLVGATMETRAGVNLHKKSNFLFAHSSIVYTHIFVIMLSANKGTTIKCLHFLISYVCRYM